MTQKVIITGANGQLGQALQQHHPIGVELYPQTSAQLDITNIESVKSVVTSIAPDWIINCAAYTAVDNAEKEKEAAYAVNSEGVKYLAHSAKSVGSKLVQISTDFVFDGNSPVPYETGDATSPLSVYGASKLMGEKHVAEILEEDSLIIRTAWLYSEKDGNFVSTMLRLMQERDELNIISDQIGTPTSCDSLAKVIWQLVQKSVKGGIYHYTDNGTASWYDFAAAIYRLGIKQGLLDKNIVINAIASSQYPTLAQRPHYSVLDKSKTWHVLGYQAAHWQEELEKILLKRAIDE